MDSIIAAASSSLSSIGLPIAGVMDFLKDRVLEGVGTSLLFIQETWIYWLALVVIGAVYAYMKGFAFFGRR